MSSLSALQNAAFDALGSPIRRDIVTLLAKKQRPVGELAAHLPVSRPAVSKHLRLLQDAGLVTSQALGNRNVYRLEARGFEAAKGWLDGFWDDALSRFKLLAENSEVDRADD